MSMKLKTLYRIFSPEPIAPRLRQMAYEVEHETDRDDRTEAVAVLVLSESGKLELTSMGIADHYRVRGMLLAAVEGTRTVP